MKKRTFSAPRLSRNFSRKSKNAKSFKDSVDKEDDSFGLDTLKKIDSQYNNFVNEQKNNSVNESQFTGDRSQFNQFDIHNDLDR